jgi:hypothetical protein
VIKKILKIIGGVLAAITVIFGIILFRGYRFYNSVFRISYEEANNALLDAAPQCTKLSECNLQSGDIIIRRYVTPVTKLFDETLDPYFTHSALYLGDDEIFEAVGNYTDPQDQITIDKLSQSDWFDAQLEDFVVIRPKNYNGKLEETVSALKNMADDPSYVFGIFNEQKKTASCSDSIFFQLEK